MDGFNGTLFAYGQVFNIYKNENKIKIIKIIKMRIK